jgi:lambda repressor-like predicted transcriptional regulator
VSATTITLHRPSPARWPIGPLVAVTGRTAAALAAEAGFTRRSGTRWGSAGWVNDETADRLACAAGLHPAEVWPGWFAAAPEEALAC